ncbi:unnamed protein product [Clonostachys byssicola]|uniref:Uncharacterized protein n=1 Tax=Clonostachys byssicola TaxID=160290 RepID=A0A9N9UQM8_9HYPO|nr:unnamed protein product [Clonostachys byssicola]
MILPSLSSSTIRGSLDPGSSHSTGTTVVASGHKALRVVTHPTTHPYIPASSVVPKTRSAGYSDGTHHLSTDTGRLGPRDPTSQHDGSSDKTALIIMGTAARRNTRELPAYFAFVALHGAEGTEGGLELPGREALVASRDLRDEKALLGHKDPKGIRESGESGESRDSKAIQGNKESRAPKALKDPEVIQGSREIRDLLGRMARRALMALKVAEDAEDAKDVEDAEDTQDNREKVALPGRMAHRELLALKDLQDPKGI